MDTQNIQIPTITSKAPTIAIIDDDEILSQNMFDYFSSKGFECLMANDGNAGLLLIHDNLPDVILLDIMMPVKNGIDVLKAISQSNPSYLNQFILLTNSEDMTYVSEALMLGLKDYLLKSDMSLEAIYELSQRKVAQSVQYKPKNT
jgi:DNA-binding response OmpR family regulator